MHDNAMCSEMVLTGFASDRFIFNATSFITSKVYLMARLCTIQFTFKLFFALDTYIVITWFMVALI